jgi:hypothetical protein
MYLQEILEVAVGLIFLWLVISVGALACFLTAGEACQIIPVSRNVVWGMWSTNVC